jgi:hypothetical protein
VPPRRLSRRLSDTRVVWRYNHVPVTYLDMICMYAFQYFRIPKLCMHRRPHTRACECACARYARATLSRACVSVYIPAKKRATFSIRISCVHSCASAFVLLLAYIHSRGVTPEMHRWRMLHVRARVCAGTERDRTSSVRLFLSWRPLRRFKACALYRRGTPLHFAARPGHVPVLELLLSHGADVYATDYNRSPCTHAYGSVVCGG